MGSRLTCCVNSGSNCHEVLNSRSLDEVTVALRGLLGDESITLIFGISFARKPGWTAGERNLHRIRNNELNNYEKVITIIGSTVNNINPAHRPIYVFGFAEGIEYLVNLIDSSYIYFFVFHLKLILVKTPDENIFKFLTEPCDGYKQALIEYRRLAEYARPTEIVSYGPIIRKATRMASENPDKHHVLVIVAGEPVTRNDFTELGELSTYEDNTYSAIEAARNYRLSIVLVGVGETNGKMNKGLWISRCCRPNNFNFVDYTQIISKPPVAGTDNDTEFCVAVTKNLHKQIRRSNSQRFTNLADVVPEPENLLS
ncbi:hypothetical protein MKX01_031183 [Papaver californicum]|nr:hypothetical protein MKX01_031183 [Papaver californicum]